MKDKERLGKRIKWDATAIFIFSEPKKQETTAQLNAPKMMFASFNPADQQTMSDGTGEATFITYEGASNTWDGTVSVTDYYTGENRVYNSDMSDFGAPDNPAVWDVTNEIYYPPGGGDPTQCPAHTPCLEEPPVSQKRGADSSAASLMMNVSYTRATTSPEPAGPVFRWFSNFWRCYSRTLAFVGRQCVSPQPNIRNNLICAIAAGIYAAGCCARFAHQNAGQGRCYQ
jgi:hypothetical protein